MVALPNFVRSRDMLNPLPVFILFRNRSGGKKEERGGKRQRKVGEASRMGFRRRRRPHSQ